MITTDYSLYIFFAKSIAKLATFLRYSGPTRNLNFLELTLPPPHIAIHPSAAFAQTPSLSKRLPPGGKQRGVESKQEGVNGVYKTKIMKTEKRNLKFYET